MIAATLGVALVSVGATPAPAATVAAPAAEPAEVLHYRLRVSQPGSPMNPGQDLSLMDVWQAGDGSRVRALVERDFTRSVGEPSIAGHERVLTRGESRSWSPGEKAMVSSYHLPFPGVGHVVRAGAAFSWLPSDWGWQTSPT